MVGSLVCTASPRKQESMQRSALGGRLIPTSEYILVQFGYGLNSALWLKTKRRL